MTTSQTEPEYARAMDDVFAGGGEMGALMRTVDWASTPIGPVEDWPQSLRTAVSICLASRFPILIWWGPELVKLYNDAYRPMLGATKHPRSMGQRGRECWPEIWHIIGPMLEEVLTEGKATWSDDQLLPLDRNGYVEECYFTFSYSPIRDETGGIGGVFTAVTETTGRVIGERRLALLRELAARTNVARRVEEVCDLAMDVLAEASADVPFALLYLIDEDRTQARLACSAGVSPDTPAAPLVVEMDDSSDSVWPLASVAHAGRLEIVGDAATRFGSSLENAVLPRQVLVLPIGQAGQEAPAALLVAGASPRKALDDDYLGFFQLVAGQIASAMNDARAHEEERKRAEALAELDRAKTAFFSNVSHEFRTPLTLVLGPLEDTLADNRLSREQRVRLEIVQRNALRLLKLVNSLLDFSRIEADRLQAEYEPLNLASFTAELASLFRSAAERVGLRLLVDCPPLPEPVYVDREMWEKVVLNLLSNAIKFTFDGEITVVVQSAGSHVTLTVRDTGTGIPAEELPHLFTRFHRVRGARARTHEGTGIGLALTQELVRLHGGTIDVASVVGEGTTFTVSIPFGSHHLPAEHIRSAGSARPTLPLAAPYLEEVLQWADEEGQVPGEVEETARVDSTSVSVAAETAASREHARGRILVADDNADMRQYVSRLLRGDYTVYAAADGTAALSAAQTERPDLVLSDIMMPGMDGLELLRALRSDPGTATIPVILLSARAGEEAAVEGLQAGADDYLVKPFSARELLARVKVHIDMARAREELEREKDEFLSATAHDLKGPLTTIKGFTQLLQRQLKRHGVLEPGRAGDALQHIEKTATRLAQLITELQDITLIRAGHALTLQLAPIDLTHLVEEAVEQFEQTVSSHHIDLALPPDQLMFVGDASRLERVLSNLLSNAVKYSPPDTSISVSLAQEGNGSESAAVITVADRGIGIPAVDLPHIFDPFARGSNVSSDASGTGIGLASVRQIVEQHHGTVSVDSREGEGSTFRVRLPLAAPGGAHQS